MSNIISVKKEDVKKNLVAKTVYICVLVALYGLFWGQHIAYELEQFYPERIVVATILVLIGIIVAFIHIEIPDKLNTLISILAAVVAIIFNFIMIEYSYGNQWTMISKSKIIANLIVIGTILLVSYAISNSFKFSILFLNVVSVVFALTNYFVTLFRGTALLAADFFSIGTAKNVAAGYTYTLNYNAYIMLLAVVVASAFVFKLGKNTFMRGWLRVIPIVLAVACVSFVFGVFVNYDGLSKTLKIKMYKPQETYAKNGMYLTFVHSIKYLSVEEPEGYSVDKVKKLAKKYKGTVESGDGKKPNIIMIMNEAFTDFSEIGNLKVNKDYLPFCHSLNENTIKGQVFVTVFGGGTANTEFEAVTSNSLAFVPVGGTPYVNYITGDTPSNATSLKAQGYGGLIAMHPFKGNGYKRDKVYPLLGYNRFITIDDFQNPRWVRNFISDESNYDRIISEYENYKKNNSDPFFLYNVTIQNHSPFDQEWDNLSKDIKTEYDFGTDVNVYLNLIKESDDAFKKLVEYFEKQDEPTIILMFGDHQPKILSNGFYKSIKKSFKLDDVYKHFNKHQTPFVIWANYDIQEQTGVMTSANYLNTIISDVAGTKKSGYEQLISEVRKEVPVITQKGYVGANGKFYLPDDKKSPYYDILQEYNYAEYNNLFDSKNRVKEFFTVNN